MARITIDSTTEAFENDEELTERTPLMINDIMKLINIY